MNWQGDCWRCGRIDGHASWCEIGQGTGVRLSRPRPPGPTDTGDTDD